MRHLVLILILITVKLSILLCDKLKKNILNALFKDRRPYLASDCDNLQEAEKWRRQIIGEISRKVAQIQNGAFNSFKFMKACGEKFILYC